MKQEEKNNEVDINERAITLEVDSEVIGRVRTGEITHILMDINEDNKSLILENFDGNLVLVTDELPDTFHGCYFYNGGEFPYAIKGSLDFLVLNGGEDECLTRIIDVDTTPGTRFNYQGAGNRRASRYIPRMLFLQWRRISIRHQRIAGLLGIKWW